jgi:hypothetical protein
MEAADPSRRGTPRPQMRLAATAANIQHGCQTIARCGSLEHRNTRRCNRGASSRMGPWACDVVSARGRDRVDRSRSGSGASRRGRRASSGRAVRLAHTGNRGHRNRSSIGCFNNAVGWEVCSCARPRHRICRGNDHPYRCCRPVSFGRWPTTSRDRFPR